MYIYINTLIWACTIELLLPFDRSKGRKLGLVPWCHIKFGWYFCQFIYMYNGSKSGIGHIYIYLYGVLLPTRVWAEIGYIWFWAT